MLAVGVDILSIGREILANVDRVRRGESDGGRVLEDVV